jgi:hypothetical protein
LNSVKQDQPPIDKADLANLEKVCLSDNAIKAIVFRS